MNDVVRLLVGYIALIREDPVAVTIGLVVIAALIGIFYRWQAKRHVPGASFTRDDAAIGIPLALAALTIHFIDLVRLLSLGLSGSLTPTRLDGVREEVFVSLVIHVALVLGFWCLIAWVRTVGREQDNRLTGPG